MFLDRKAITTPPKHFGTFIVILPSDRGGWSLCLREGEEEAKCSMGEENVFSSMSCFWLDGTNPTLRHDDPDGGITALLLYDLYWSDNSPKPIIDAESAIQGILTNYLKIWSSGNSERSEDRQTRFILHKLSQYYAIYSPGAMAPKDRKTLLLLDMACHQSDFSLWFVTVRREENCRTDVYNPYSGRRHNDYSIWDEIETDAEVICIAGKHLDSGTQFSIQYVDFLGEEWFNCDPDNSDSILSSDTNWSYNRYSDSALIMVPNDNAAEFLIHHVLDNEAKARQIQNAYQLFVEREEEHAIWWAALCQAALTDPNPRKREPNDTDVAKVAIETSFQISDEISETVLHMALLKWRPDITCLSPEDYQAFAKATARLGWPIIGGVLCHVFQCTMDLLKFYNALDSFRKEYCMALEREVELDQIEGIFDDQIQLPLPETVEEWTQSRLCEAVEEVDLSDWENFSSLEPILDKITVHSQGAFAKACATSISRAAKDEYVETSQGPWCVWKQPSGRRTLGRWRDQYNPRQDIYVLSTYGIFEIFKKRQQKSSEYTQVVEAAVLALTQILFIQPYQPIQDEYLCKILEAIASTSSSLLEDFARRMLPSKLIHRSNGISQQWLPKLPGLAEIARKYPVASKSCHVIIATILCVFLAMDIGHEPIPKNTLKRGTITCTCPICKEINTLLENDDPNYLHNFELYWPAEQCKHARAQLKNVENASDELEFGVRNEKATGVATSIWVKKVDKKFKTALKTREDNIKMYRAIMKRMSDIYQDEDASSVFGKLTVILQAMDLVASIKFLQNLVEQSLDSTFFSVHDIDEVATRQQVKEVVESRGGLISEYKLPNDESNARPSTRHDSAPKLVSLVSSTTFPDNLDQALAQFRSDAATAVPIELNITNFQPFVDHIWYDCLVEKLNIPSSKNVRPSGIKRKFSEITDRPRADIMKGYENPELRAPRVNELVQKIRKITPKYTPASYFDKENIPTNRELEVIHLT